MQEQFIDPAVEGLSPHTPNARLICCGVFRFLFFFASLEFNAECLLLAPIALERGVQLRSAISNLRAAIESGGCRVYPDRTFDSRVDELLLHSRHSRHPWRSDSVVEPPWMGSRRVLTGYTRQPADRTKPNTTEP